MKGSGVGRGAGKVAAGETFYADVLSQMNLTFRKIVHERYRRVVLQHT